MPRGVKKAAPAVAEKENILEPFKKIGKADKNRFAKVAAKMGISQEELLGLAVQAVSKGKVKFEAKKRKVEDVAASLNDKDGEGTVVLKVKDQYYNMAEKIAPVMFLIDEAKAAMTELGITPKVSPIRGGTDGARLSFEGLPCPNLCTGGLNYHGRYEYCCIQSMEKIVELLVNLVQRL